jgi:hypothetical protein
MFYLGGTLTRLTYVLGAGKRRVSERVGAFTLDAAQSSDPAATPYAPAGMLR